MSQIQFIQITPEELQEAIVRGVKEELQEIKQNFQPKEPTEYMTKAEVKDLFKVELTTIWNWTKKGKLKAYGIGGRVYYKRHEVEAQLIPLNENKGA